MFLLAIVCFCSNLGLRCSRVPYLFFFFKYSFFLLFIFDCAGSSSLLRSLSLVGVQGLLLVAAHALLLLAPLSSEHGLQAHGLSSVAHGL